MNWLESALGYVWAAIINVLIWIRKEADEPVTPSNDPFEAAYDLIVSKGVTDAVRYYTLPNGTKLITAEILPVNKDDAKSIATNVVKASQKTQLPLAYLLSCIYAESNFSPSAVNYNLATYNGELTFEGTDWGLVQFSGFDLPALTKIKLALPGDIPNPNPTKLNLHSMQNPDITITKNILQAHDIAWAIDNFSSLMTTHYQAAKKLLAQPGILDKIIALPEAVYPPKMVLDFEDGLWMWAATIMYNTGEEGFKLMLDNKGYNKHGVLEGHGHHVITYMTEFYPLLPH